MSKLFLLISVLFVASTYNGQENTCSFAKSANMKKVFQYNKTAYPGDNSFDATYYKLNLIIDYDSEFLNGEVTINGLSKSENLSSIFLDLQNSFNVDSVKYMNNSLEYSHQSAKLYINFPLPLGTDEEFSLVVFYQGKPGSSGFGSFEFSNTTGGHPAIWTLSEPYGASDWWPCKDSPADKVDSSDVIVTADNDFVTVSNGKLIETIDNGNGTKTYNWKNSYPIAHYLISLAMANYNTFEEYWNYNGTDSMQVIHYNYPENLTTTRINQLKKTIPMLNEFSEMFGLYPFINEKYGHAEFGWSGGMEHQTISSMGSFGEDIVSHELAHQWFGDKITCANWQNIWLNEGFATYSEALWLEKAYGKTRYNSKIIDEMGSPTKWWTAKAANGSIYVKDISSVNSIFNSARSYAKGAIVLHMLRGVLGDEDFFKVIYEYSNHPEFAFKAAVTEDFQAVAEEVSGEDLDYFFDEWIYGENYPKYNYSYIIDPSTSNLIVNILQFTNTNPTYFTMPIQLRLYNTEIDTIVTVFSNQRSQIFEFPGINSITNVIFDPNNWIMKDVDYVANIDEIINPNEFNLYQNYPNPFNPNTNIKYSIPTKENVSLKIYDILGNEISILVDEQKIAGTYEVDFDASNLPTGIYFYVLKAGNYIQSNKMLFLK